MYRDTDGATLASISKDLGINDVTLATWCKNAGVSIRHGRLTEPSSAAGPDETADEELARLRAEVRDRRSDKTMLTTERDILRSAANISPGRRAGEPLRSSSQTTGTPSRLCEAVEVARSSF